MKLKWRMAFIKTISNNWHKVDANDDGDNINVVCPSSTHRNVSQKLLGKTSRAR